MDTGLESNSLGIFKQKIYKHAKKDTNVKGYQGLKGWPISDFHHFHQRWLIIISHVGIIHHFCGWGGPMIVHKSSYWGCWYSCLVGENWPRFHCVKEGYKLPRNDEIFALKPPHSGVVHVYHVHFQTHHSCWFYYKTQFLPISPNCFWLHPRLFCWLIFPVFGQMPSFKPSSDKCKACWYRPGVVQACARLLGEVW